MDVLAALWIAAVEWGSVGEWVAGLAAAGGLVFAGWEIRESRRERVSAEEQRRQEESEHRVAMARAVGVMATFSPSGRAPDGRDQYRMHYTVANAGDYPIDDVVLVVADPGAENSQPEDQVGTASELILGTVMPGQTAKGSQTMTFTEDPAFGELLGLASLLFTDTWNRSWHRGPGYLNERPGPPLVC